MAQVLWAERASALPVPTHAQIIFERPFDPREG
jgi:hypothetical protein